MARPNSNEGLKERYATLEPRVKHISEATIRKKWKKLPSASHNAAREVILSSKEQSRDRKGRSAIDTAVEDCVEEIASRLSDKLPRIPFPPSTDEHHFDHELNLNRIAKVEEQMTADTHSMNLLKAQIEKEENLLKQDEAELAHLEESLKANEALRRDQSRTLHPIARRLGQHQDNIDLLGLEATSKKPIKPSLAELFDDEEMLPILEQLQNHLDSMQNNVADIKQVRDATTQAAVELQLYTLTHLGNKANVT